MAVAIIVKATGRGRIRAQRADDPRTGLYVGANEVYYANPGVPLPSTAPYDFAAKKLAAKLGWQGDYVRGCLGPDSYVYVCKFAHELTL